MGVTVVKDTFVLPSELFKRMPGREVMREVGLLAREQILRRTAEGRDADGRPFAPYSESYAELKAKELGTRDVNLQVSGRMLDGLRIVEVTDTSVTLGFTD